MDCQPVSVLNHLLVNRTQNSRLLKVLVTTLRDGNAAMLLIRKPLISRESESEMLRLICLGFSLTRLRSPTGLKHAQRKDPLSYACL